MPHSGHNATAQQNIRAMQFAPRRIHRQDGVGILDQDFRHKTLSPPSVLGPRRDRRGKDSRRVSLDGLGVQESQSLCMNLAVGCG